ncbi:MAG TPA: hypothetical protein VF258_10860 [Luteolibacter sp.]
MADRQHVLLDSMPELTWVKSELKLSDWQFQKVSDLHAAYRPKCMELCRRIAAAHEKVEDLIRENPAVTPELESAIRERAAIHGECQQAMLHHIFQTAGVMDRDQAALYLKEVLPFALDFGNSEPGEIHGR